MSTGNECQHVLDCLRGGSIINIIQNQKPTGVLNQPTNGCSHFHFLFLPILLRKIKYERPRQLSKMSAKVFRRISNHKKNGVILFIVAPPVFDGEACLADSP